MGGHFGGYRPLLFAGLESLMDIKAGSPIMPFGLVGSIDETGMSIASTN